MDVPGCARSSVRSDEPDGGREPGSKSRSIWLVTTFSLEIVLGLHNSGILRQNTLNTT
jgi:hypothetical protein